MITATIKPERLAPGSYVLPGGLTIERSERSGWIIKCNGISYGQPFGSYRRAAEYAAEWSAQRQARGY